MKKTNKLFLAAALLVSGSLVSCGGGNGMRVGVGYSATYENKAATDWAPACSQVDLTAAFAAFDGAGKIIDARFDVVQLKFTANSDNTGLALINTNVDASYSVTSKLELGDAYNMKGSSAIGKEVDEQIEAFADWTVGKTVKEIKNLVAEEHGYGVAPHADLTTSCTIVVHEFVNALECAFQNKSKAKYDIVEGTEYKAGIGLQSGLAYVSGGGATKELDVVIGGTLVADNTVVAGTFDEVVFPVAIANDGKLSADESEAGKYNVGGVLKSKKVLKDAYAMGPVSPLKKGEWYQQAEALDAAIAGKTADQIRTLVAGEGELTGCTMTISSYVNALAKSVAYANLADVA